MVSFKIVYWLNKEILENPKILGWFRSSLEQALCSHRRRISEKIIEPQTLESM
jgi:hypothetical protein